MKKYYPGLDLLKFIMALTIVSLHFDLFRENMMLYEFVLPWKNIAVPVFFMVSSFLLCRKLLSFNDNKEEDKVILHFLKRIGILYAFWFVVMIRGTIYKWNWGGHFTITEFITQFFLSSTFSGSWFLMALSINIVLIWYIRRFLSEGWVVALSIILYVYNCYAPMMPEPWNVMYNWYDSLPNVTPQTSFPGTMLFVYAGVFLAHDKTGDIYGKFNAVLLLSAFVIIYVLSLNTYFYPIGRLAGAIILFILGCNLKTEKKYTLLRQSSIFIFFIHFQFLGKFPFTTPINYLCACAVSFILAMTVIWLKEKKGFRWLKYSL